MKICYLGYDFFYSCLEEILKQKNEVVKKEAGLTLIALVVTMSVALFPPCFR